MTRVLAPRWRTTVWVRFSEAACWLFLSISGNSWWRACARFLWDILTIFLRWVFPVLPVNSLTKTWMSPTDPWACLWYGEVESLLWSSSKSRTIKQSVNLSRAELNPTVLQFCWPIILNMLTHTQATVTAVVSCWAWNSYFVSTCLPVPYVPSATRPASPWFLLTSCSSVRITRLLARPDGHSPSESTARMPLYFPVWPAIPKRLGTWSWSWRWG